MGRVDDEPVWLGGPDFGDIFLECQTAQGLAPTGKVIGGDEVVEMRSQLVVAFVMEALDGRLFDGAVHSFDLPVGPGVVRFGQPALNIVRLADYVDAYPARPGSVTVARLLGELDASLRIDPPDQSVAVGVG